MKRKILPLLLAIAQLHFKLAAAERFDWEAITADDWSPMYDSAQNRHGAVMMFEKIVADDRRLDQGKCYLSIYRRLRILNTEGQKWGDVQAPNIHSEQKIEEIYGRTVHSDGREFILASNQIFEKEINVAGNVKIKQTRFSLPGMSADCIVEYVIKYRLPAPAGVWIMQKDIALRRGEYRWLIYREHDMQQFKHGWLWENLTDATAFGHNQERSSATSFPSPPARASEEATSSLPEPVTDMAPSYIWSHNKPTVSVQLLPSAQNPQELLFSARDLPAFVQESHTLPETALREQLQCYYGTAATAKAFWEAVGSQIFQEQADFNRKNQRVQHAVSLWTNLSHDTKIEAAYRWLQEQFVKKNDINPGKEFKRNETADETLTRGYGTQEDINSVFCGMLQELGIDARLAYVTDSDRHVFMPEAKFWQFHRSLVAVPDMIDGYRFYSPGDLHLPLGQAPWFCEGNPALIAGASPRRFVTVPFSKAETNRMGSLVRLRLHEDLKADGVISEHRSGHGASAIRLALANFGENARHERLKTELAKDFPHAQMDSLVVSNFSESGAALMLQYNVLFPKQARQTGKLVLVRVSDFLGHTQNPFQAEARHHPIVFEYAFERRETVEIQLPPNCSIEALPTDTLFANAAGQCGVLFEKYSKTVAIQRLFRLNHPYWMPIAYPAVQELFQTQQAMNGLMIVLKLENNRVAAKPQSQAARATGYEACLECAFRQGMMF